MEIKTFDLKKMVEGSEEEYVLGAKETGSHACYMIYGIIKPNEGGRIIKPGAGHEEIVLAAKGSFQVSGEINGILHEGQAFHIVGDESCLLYNNGDSGAVYIIAGGHSEGGH